MEDNPTQPVMPKTTITHTGDFFLHPFKVSESRSHFVSTDPSKWSGEGGPRLRAESEHPVHGPLPVQPHPTHPAVTAVQVCTCTFRIPAGVAIKLKLSCDSALQWFFSFNRMRFLISMGFFHYIKLDALGFRLHGPAPYPSFTKPHLWLILVSIYLSLSSFS